MKRPPLLNNYIYHIYNRGVEKRAIFRDEHDYLCFVHDLYEFNDENYASNVHYWFKNMGSRNPYFNKERKPIVDILAWCLMPNHFHLLIRQRKDNGIALFMRKLGSGYANFFNMKYKRVGPLFQGRYKIIMVDKDEYLLHLINYIHSNPVKLVEPHWKGKESRI